MNTKSMRWIVYLAGSFGVLLATVITGLAIVTRDWNHVALGGIWLFLVSANFREWMLNQQRRDSWLEKQRADLHRDQVVWTEQVLTSKALVASRLADRITRLGLEGDAKAISAVGSLFAEISKIELPDGVSDEIIALHAKAADVAKACRRGKFPDERVLH